MHTGTYHTCSRQSSVAPPASTLIGATASSNSMDVLCIMSSQKNVLRNNTSLQIARSQRDTNCATAYEHCCSPVARRCRLSGLRGGDTLGWVGWHNRTPAAGQYRIQMIPHIACPLDAPSLRWNRVCTSTAAIMCARGSGRNTKTASPAGTRREHGRGHPRQSRQE